MSLLLAFALIQFFQSKSGYILQLWNDYFCTCSISSNVTIFSLRSAAALRTDFIVTFDIGPKFHFQVGLDRY